jgi:hypothetical protein
MGEEGNDESFGDDAADEVVVADGAVRRDVDLADPLVELVRLELLADGGEDVAEVGDGDGPGGVLVEDAEGVAERAVEGLGAEVGAHEVEEAGEVEGRGELLLRGDVAELRLRGVPAEGAHEDAELRGRDAAVAVGVEEREGLPHGGDLVLGEVLAAHRAAGDRIGAGGVGGDLAARGRGGVWGCCCSRLRVGLIGWCRGGGESESRGGLVATLVVACRGGLAGGIGFGLIDTRAS